MNAKKTQKSAGIKLTASNSMFKKLEARFKIKRIPLEPYKAKWAGPSKS